MARTLSSILLLVVAGANTCPASAQYDAGKGVPVHATDIVDLGLGWPPDSLLPMDAMRKASQSRLAAGQSSSLLQYSPGQKQPPELPQSLGRYLGVDTNQLVITDGVDSMLGLMCQRYLANGGVILLEEASYFSAFQNLHSCQDVKPTLATVKTKPGGYMDVDDLERMLQLHKGAVRLLYTIPEFHNPLTGTLPESDRRKVIALAERFDFIIIADEVYRLVNFVDTVPPSFADLTKQPRVVATSSFAKFFNAPGLSLGWLRAAPSLAAELRPRLTAKDWFVQGLVAEALDQGLVAGVRARVLATLKARERALRDALVAEGIAVNASNGGYFLWLCTAHDSSKVLEAARRKGVVFTLGSSFSIDGSVFKNCMRLCYARTDEAKLRLGAQRLAAALGEVEMMSRWDLPPQQVEIFN